MKCKRCHGTGEEKGPERVLLLCQYKTAAREIREAAKFRRAQASEFVGEPDMQRMFIGDAKDLRLVAKYLLAGDAGSAARTAGNMDTAARDSIPEAAWNFMQQRAAIQQKAEAEDTAARFSHFCLRTDIWEISTK